MQHPRGGPPRQPLSRPCSAHPPRYVRVTASVAAGLGLVVASSGGMVTRGASLVTVAKKLGERFLACSAEVAREAIQKPL